MPNLDNVHPVLAAGVQGMLDECPKGLYISSAYRSYSAQMALWLRSFIPGQPKANRPGSSDHEKDPCEAVDVGARPGYEAERERLRIKHGLLKPYPHEPWHFVRDRRKKAPQPVTPTVPVIEEDEEMPKYADEYTWEDGAQVQVFPDGSVKCFLARSWGSIHSLKPEAKVTFGKAASVRPVNPKNSSHGYIIFDEEGEPYTFNGDPIEIRKFFTAAEQKKFLG